MNRAYVLNDVAYGLKVGGGTISGRNEVNLLAPGALALFTEAGTLVVLGTLGTTLNDSKAVYFAIGKKNGGAEVTQLIPREPVVYQAKNYTAPVVELQFVGQDGTTGSLNFPTLTAGLEYNISISDESKHGIDPSLRRKFNVSGVTTASSTAASILAEVAARFNAMTDCPCTVAVVGANVGLSFTNKLVETKVTIGKSGLFASSTLHTNGDNAAVAPVYGIGTPARVQESLDLHFSELGKGDGGLMPDKFFTFESNLSSTGTYDTYIISWVERANAAIGPKEGVHNNVTLFMPNAAAIQANFQLAMAAVFGTNTANPVETGADTAV